MVLDFTIDNGRVVAIEAIADPARVAELDLAVLEDARIEPSALP
jgi:hypothetical protein